MVVILPLRNFLPSGILSLRDVLDLGGVGGRLAMFRKIVLADAGGCAVCVVAGNCVIVTPLLDADNCGVLDDGVAVVLVFLYTVNSSSDELSEELPSLESSCKASDS